VILKSAMSLDGRIATRTGDSKWITSEQARAYAHRIRSEVDCIIVGGNTARIDDPSLTARLGNKTYYPTRVVLTATGDLPAGLKLFAKPGEAIVAVGPNANTQALRKLESAGARILTLEDAGGRPSIRDLMRKLAELGNLSVLIEGGGEVAASALEEHVVDKVLYFHAPRIIGGRDAVPSVGGLGAELVSESVSLRDMKIRRFGRDVAVEGYVEYAERTAVIPNEREESQPTE